MKSSNKTDPKIALPRQLVDAIDRAADRILLTRSAWLRLAVQRALREGVVAGNDLGTFR